MPTHRRSTDVDTGHPASTVTAASVAVLVAVTGLVLGSWWIGVADRAEESGDDRLAARGGTAPGPRSDTADAADANAPTDPTGTADPTDPADPADPADTAVEVLRAWDRARATAWARGDPAALAELYVEGSVAGERDVARLRRWLDRGLRVRGMRMQVLRVDVRRHTDRRLVLRVTDRLTGAVAVRPTDGRTWDLPADRADTRRLAFRRTAGRWRLASSYDRPLARIASTSGSAIS